MTTKQPRKVALIDVRDCPRCDYGAYWNISVEGDDAEGYRWEVKIMSYEPIGWQWNGKVSAERPDAPLPVYPGGVKVTQAEYLKMSDADQARVRAAQDEFRRQCSAIYEAHPKPVHLIAEEMGLADTKDAADTAAQEWVREHMKGQRKPKPAALHGYAIPLPLDPIGDLVRDVFDELRYRWRRHVRPLLAIAYSATIRNNKQNQTRDGIDGGAGAGLLRIYDGTRPATCGTATTLGAELTYSDPCAPAASGGVLTFSAITADASANASITASWYRSVDSTGTCAEDGNVGTSGSDLNLNTVTITVGVQVSVTSKTITGGNA